MNYELLRNAPVKASAIEFNKKMFARIEIDGKYEHTFDSKSRVSKALQVMSPDALTERLTGGHYFFVNGQLVDFRDRMYNGFVHTDEAIAQLADVIGFTDANSNSIGTGIRSFKRNTVANSILLGTVWSHNEITVPGYRSGGEFNSQLVFVWNPFVHTINSMFQLVRLICSNGMVGLTDFLNTKIPLQNRWREHLDIASRQIQHKMEEITQSRFAAMSTERASVAECEQITSHAHARLKAHAEQKVFLTDDEVNTLQTIQTLSDCRTQLRDVLRTDVFNDKRLAAHVPSHLTTFDVYNMATEMRSHTTESPESTNFALDRIANGLLFDHKGLTGVVSQFAHKERVATFSDPEVAFFGKLH